MLDENNIYISNAFEAHLKEYDALRGEIMQNMNHAEKITGYTLVALAGLWGAQKWIIDNPEIAIMLLIFPVIFSLLGILFLDRIIRVNRLADYIHNVLRNKILTNCADFVIQWEIYKIHLAVNPTMLVKAANISRMGLFIIPSVISIIIFIVGEYYKNSPFFSVFFIMIDIFVMVFLIIGFIRINEASGVNVNKNIACDEFESEHVNRIDNIH